MKRRENDGGREAFDDDDNKFRPEDIAEPAPIASFPFADVHEKESAGFREDRIARPDDATKPERRNIDAIIAAGLAGLAIGIAGSLGIQNATRDHRGDMPGWTADPSDDVRIRWMREGAEACLTINGASQAQMLGGAHRDQRGNPVVDVICVVPYGRKEGQGPTFSVTVPIGEDG